MRRSSRKALPGHGGPSVGLTADPRAARESRGGTRRRRRRRRRWWWTLTAALRGEEGLLPNSAP